MASIQKRNSTYSVVYTYKYENGKKKQKWETCGSYKNAQKRKREIENQIENNNFIIPNIKTLSDLLDEFVNSYGLNKWSLSTFRAKKGLINNYINPILGDTKIQSISKRTINTFYNTTLPNTKAVISKGHTDHGVFVSSRTIIEIHKILNCAFNDAVNLEILSKNPTINVTLPKVKSVQRKTWDFETLRLALSCCENETLLACMHLAFACSLRLGEICGMTWDNIDIKEDSITMGNATVSVEKTLTRASREAISVLKGKDIIKIFPTKSPTSKSVLVFKTPKTESSIRTVWLPNTVSQILKEVKQSQIELKEVLGAEYQDNNLVIALPNGKPVDLRVIEKWFKKFTHANNLPDVVFHSIRHNSTTYKLRLYGDIKAVQGDTGHAQSKMVADVYSRIIDEDRKHNAARFEDDFYQNTETTNSKNKNKDKDKLIELLEKSPELVEPMMTLLTQLSDK